MSFDLEKARATYSAGCAEDAANLVPDLIAGIERLRADNACLSKAVISIQEERDLAQAEFRAYHKAWEEQQAELASANVELMAAGETVRAKEARIEELEDALAEYRKLGKTIAGKVPCLTLHGDCGRCSTQAREVCGALEQLAAGKIGPDASKPRSWQITDERRRALSEATTFLPEGYGGDTARIRNVLRGMLEEATR